MQYYRLFFILMIFFTSSHHLFSQKLTEEESALGVWLSGNKAEKIEVYKNAKDGLYYGKLVWTKFDKMPDGTPLTDNKNPDESLRDRPVVGVDILQGFSYAGNGKYTGGKVYDITHGKIYDGIITIDGDDASIRGYFLIPLIGRTETATRVKE